MIEALDPKIGARPGHLYDDFADLLHHTHSAHGFPNREQTFAVMHYLKRGKAGPNNAAPPPSQPLRRQLSREEQYERWTQNLQRAQQQMRSQVQDILAQYVQMDDVTVSDESPEAKMLN